MRSIRPITWYLPKPDFLQNNEGKRKYDRTPRCHFPFWGSQSSLWKAGAWGMRILQSSFAHERVRCCSLALKVKPQCLSRLREDFSWVHSCQHFRPQWRDQSTYTATSTQQLISWQWDTNSEVHWSKIRKKRSRTWYTRSDLEGRMNKWLVACTRDTVRSHTDDGLLFLVTAARSSPPIPAITDLNKHCISVLLMEDRGKDGLKLSSNHQVHSWQTW